jgi:glycosyltransferase involved in cell wall biosynthesis
MRTLVVSHSCVVDVNQKPYAHLASRGHEIAIAVPSSWRHDYSPSAIRPRRLRGFFGPLVPFRVIMRGSGALHSYMQPLRPILRSWKPTSVYIEEEPYSIAAYQWARASQAAGIPYAFFSLQNIPKRYPLPFAHSQRYVYAHATLGVALSSEVRDTLRQTGFSGTVEQLPLFVDTSVFHPRRGAARSAQYSFSGPVIGFLGRLVPEKGIHVLLDAFRSIRESTGASLLCIGSGPLAPLCRNTPGVLVADDVQHADVPFHLAAVDVLVLPSLTTKGWREQFGRALIEAMACEIPVVGTDSGEIPNLIQETGGGLVVREGRAPELADAIVRLLQDSSLSRSLAQRGRQEVLRRYSLDAVCDRLECILQRLSSPSR